MEHERRPVALSEREIRFNQWIGNNGIRRFFFDLDDTICATRRVIRGALAEAGVLLEAYDPTMTRKQWREDVNAIDSHLFEKYSVNPNRWNLTAEELAQKHSLPEELEQKIKQLFQQIYVTPLSMLDGAEEALTLFDNVNVPLAIVTHANFEWTLRKYNWLNLKRFVAWEEIVIVDEDTHKTKESWVDAIEKFGLTPAECAVVGDSPRSDINPAREIGVKHCFLVEDKNLWAVHNQPVDASVKVITSINQIPEAVGA